MTSTDECARSQGSGYIEEGAISAIRDILARIQKEDGRLSAQQDWVDEMCPPDPVVFQYENKSQRMVLEVARARKASEAMSVASRALSQLAELVSVQAAASEKSVLALQLRTGFSILPDDILAVVLEDAAYSDVMDSISMFFSDNVSTAALRTVEAAKKLSHTCQRFRHIITRLPELWNRINHWMPHEMATTCFKRLGSAVARVDIDVAMRGHSLILKFIDVAKQYSALWRKFYYYDSSWPHVNGEEAYHLFEEIGERTFKLEAHSLTYLEVKYPRSMDVHRLRDVPHFYSTWSMPNLSEMYVGGIIPVPFADATSLKNLHLVLRRGDDDSSELGRYDPLALSSFFDSCVALEELDIEVDCTAYDDEPQLFTSRPRNPISLGRVEKASFTFSDCTKKNVEPVMDNILLPVVSFMSLSVNGSSSDSVPGPKFLDVDDIIPSILSDSLRFPKLSKFQLLANLFNNEKPLRINIPFGALSNIKHLTLATNKCILSPIPEWIQLPPLKSIYLAGCYLEEGWVASFLGRLKAQGNFQPSGLDTYECFWIPPSVTVIAESGLEQSDTGVALDEEEPNYRTSSVEVKRIVNEHHRSPEPGCFACSVDVIYHKPLQGFKRAIYAEKNLYERLAFLLRTISYAKERESFLLVQNLRPPANAAIRSHGQRQASHRTLEPSSKSVSTIGARSTSGESAEDFAQTYGQTNIEEETFPILAGILHRLQDSHGDLSAQKKWFDEMCPAAEPAIFEYQAEPTQAVDDILQVTAARDALKIASRALVQLVKCISIQATVAEKYVTTLHRRRGFSSLPDEIFAVVLENATYNPESAAATIKAATTLSQTCRRFRRIMIDIPSLWNRIDDSIPPNIVSACCDRLTADIEVTLKVYSSDSEPHVVAKFINAAKQHSSRWKSFEYSFSGGSDASEVARGCAEELARETYALDASSLTLLYITYYSNPPRSIDGDHLRDATHFYSTWSMPRISGMYARGIIPIPFPGSASLKNLYLDLPRCVGGRFDLKALTSFLASCPTLEVFRMSLCSMEIDESTLLVEPVVIGCVKEAAFEFEYCSRRVARLVMAALRLPKVSNMTLNVGYFCLYGDSELEVDLEDLLLSIFSDESRFPELTELYLKIGSYSVSYMGSLLGDLEREESPLCLPFNILPKVEFLFLNIGSTIPSSIPRGKCLPSLRILQMVNCVRLGPEWLPSLLERLEVQGNLQELTVTNCSYVAPPTTSALDPGQSDTTGDGGEREPRSRFVKYTEDDLRQLTKVRSIKVL
ncbi:hypothetical protein SCHPADRAFT_889029 [Schizopora paradoxa]|uniref:Uncharacterized protein n=1 Tax=Schizopora paradoxa TaxID=27342 RepID=A0A0H2RSA5_9AGAM|nr:hypothetical protein SCHPADRAFT_889029 [Schizopora paradoxa]